MPKYRKKQIVVDAIQWTGFNKEDIIKFCDNNCSFFQTIVGTEGGYRDVCVLTIPTPEGNCNALCGDYIIKGIDGEFYPCKQYIFEKTYEDASKNKAIYILQVMKRFKRDENNPSRAERNIGWFSSLEAAIENLHTNKDVIGETVPTKTKEFGTVDYPFYPYALIEKVYEGPYSCGMQGDENDVKFFEWDIATKDYVEIPRPKELEGIIGFTLG
jgi:hypothetical protein